MALTHADYTVGWISAIPLELAAAKAMMDKPLHPILEQDIQDTNAYTLGQIGKHNVVLAIPSSTGMGAAAHAAANLLRSFPNIRFGLMVGIGGGAPGEANSTPDIRLGDVVVSYPERQHGGVIQYDFGTELQESNGIRFVRKGHLNKPPSILLTALRNLQANELMNPMMIQQHYEGMLENYPMMSMRYFRPESDELYASNYVHHGRKDDCSQCLKEELITTRAPRTTSVIHYGLIGSANTLLRSAIMRDRLREEEQIICVEMEAAGLMNEFPCLVIRGISDYCDSHKSDQWQAYSSAIAAAYAKELLLNIAPTSVSNLPRLDFLVHLAGKQLHEAQQTNRSLEYIASKLNSAEDVAARERHEKRLKDLKCIHPQFDKARLEDIRGGLLRDVYKWVLRTNEYVSWQSNGGLLWIKGDPGKGKTMLTCGIIDELEEHDTAYFFCQATIDTNNTAVSVLRGLIYAALQGDAPLSEALNDKIAQAGTLPQDSAFYIYSDIITEILNSKKIIILVDALDECLSGRDMLLRFIVKCSVTHSSRWLVTSRNYSEIEDYLGHSSRLSLELNEDSVSNAIDVFIEHKIQELTRAKRYDYELRTFILRYLFDNAKGTFLWVSLVCSGLSAVPPRRARAELLKYPSGLEKVYQRMLSMIEEAEDAEQLKQILGLVCIAFRPVTLDELSSLVDLPQEGLSCLKDFVIGCGSFLSIRKSTIEFVHQSAKEFLVKQDVFSEKKTNFHHQAFAKSLDALYSLRRNMYSLTNPGVSLDEIKIPDPDALKDVRYAGIYWADHLLHVCNSSPDGVDVTDFNLVSSFLEKKALYWIELLSLLRQVYPAISTLLMLQSTIQAYHRHEQFLSLDSSKLETLVNDTIQFLRYFQYALVQFPLQVYISGLLFCPSRSLIKHHFQHETPTWACIVRGLEESWPSHLVLGSRLRVLQWSDDGEMLATQDDTIAGKIDIWNTNSGQHLMFLPDKSLRVAFAHSNTVLMAVDLRCTSIRLWSINSGQLLGNKPFKNSVFSISRDRHESYYCQWTTSRDSSLMAHGEYGSPYIEIHCTSSGNLVDRITLEIGVHENFDMEGLVFSPNNSLLAAVAMDNSIKVLDVKSGKYLWSTSLSFSAFSMVRFSPCSTILAIGSCNGSTHFEIWDWQNDTLLLNRSRLAVGKLNFLQDSVLVASGAEIKEISLRSAFKDRTYAYLSKETSEASVVSVAPHGQKIAVTDLLNDKLWLLARTAGTSSVINCVRDTFGLKRVWLKNNNIYTVSNSDTFKIQKMPIFEVKTQDTILCTLENIEAAYEIFVSPNGCNVAIFNDDHMCLKILNLDHEDCGIQMNLETDDYCAFTWGPGEDQVTVARNDFFVGLEFWSISGNRVMRQLRYPHGLREKFAMTNYVMMVELLWSSKGSHLLISVYGVLYLWTNDPERWSNGRGIGSMARYMSFSADESLFACITDERELILFKTDTLDMLFNLEGHGYSSLLTIDANWLKTDRAWYAIPQDLTKRPETMVMQPAVHLNIECDPMKDEFWVRSGTDNIIWLPPDYRVKEDYWDIDGTTIAIGKSATHIIVLDVHWDRSKGLDSQSPEDRRPVSNHKRRRSSLAIHAHHKKDRRSS